MKSISHTTTEDVKLVTSEEFTLSSSTLSTIKNLFQDSLIPEEDSDHSSNNKNTPILAVYLRLEHTFSGQDVVELY